MSASTVWTRPAGERPRGDVGLSYESRGAVERLRRSYRLLRRSGVSAWSARAILWHVANDARRDVGFVSNLDIADVVGRVAA